jgi:hypothetical protein
MTLFAKGRTKGKRGRQKGKRKRERGRNRENRERKKEKKERKEPETEQKENEKVRMTEYEEIFDDMFDRTYFYRCCSFVDAVTSAAPSRRVEFPHRLHLRCTNIVSLGEKGNRKT